MRKLGSISEAEESFLKQGVLFFTLKTRQFSIRLEAIMERRNQIKAGNYQQAKSDERVMKIAVPEKAKPNESLKRHVEIVPLEKQ